MPPKPGSNKAQEKVEQELRKLTRLDGNKTCVDCPEKMPGYVNLTHHTFVCTRCSGIHRELQFKVKGISMSVFTAEDVADVAAVGNAAHNAIYLARFQNKEFIPNGSDILKLREFIKSKYNDKKWYANGSKGASNDRDRSSGSQVASDSGDLWGKKQSSASKSSPMIKEQIKAAPVAAADSFGLDLLDLDNSPSMPVASSKPQVSQLQHQFNNASSNAFSGPPNGAFDAFGGAQTAGFDAFGNATPSVFGSSQPAPLFDAFGSTNQPTVQTGFDAFNTPQLSKSAAIQQQLGFTDSTGFSPGAPMPFVKVSPPTPSEKAAEDAIFAAAVGRAPPPPQPKNFNVFDEIGGPPPMMHGYGPPRGYPGMPPGGFGGPGGNPFDNPASAGNPFAAPAPFGAPQGNPFGGQAPPPGAYQQPPPGYYPGMPPQAPGMPYGFPQGPPGPYGYPPRFQPHPQQGYPPYGYPPNGPPQAPGIGGNPYGAPPVPVPVKEPVAPDPFSTVGGLGWGEVSKPTAQQPTVNTFSAPYNASNNTPPLYQPQAEAQYDPYGSQQNPTTSVPSPKAAAPTPPIESGNPFDMF